MKNLLRESFQLGQQWVQDIIDYKPPKEFNDWYSSDETQKKLKNSIKEHNSKIGIHNISDDSTSISPINLLKDFSDWNNEWENYKGEGEKPKTIHDFIEEMNKKYVVKHRK